MKKRIAQFRKLNRTGSHKWSMLRNMVSSLIEHERIVTTEAKAKEVRHLAEKMITLAKKGTKRQHNVLLQNQPAPSPPHGHTPGDLVQYKRRAAKVIRGDWTLTKLFEVLGPRYQFREGGYTRILKLSKRRAGDNAPMAVIEYVDRPGEIRPARPPTIFAQQAAGAVASSTSSNTNTTTTSGNRHTPILLKGVEEALQRMGIASVDELLSKQEQQQIQKEIE